MEQELKLLPQDKRASPYLSTCETSKIGSGGKTFTDFTVAWLRQKVLDLQKRSLAAESRAGAFETMYLRERSLNTVLTKTLESKLKLLDGLILKYRETGYVTEEGGSCRER